MSGKPITGINRQLPPGSLSPVAHWLLSALQVPDDFIANWHWIAAIDAYDHEDPGLLNTLLAGNCEVPANVEQVLSDIREGKRKPNTKARYKIRGGDRFEAGLSHLCSEVMKMIVDHKTNIDNHAEFSQVEPIEIVERRDEYRKAEETALLEKYNISKDTLDDLRRELKAKIKNWPSL